ncbi:MAG: 2-hydroxymuconate tautomerase [Bacillota bacterium]
MPTIHVHIIEGRTREQKRQLVRGITDVVVKTCGANPERVVVYINEVKKEYAARAGVLRSDEEN